MSVSEIRHEEDAAVQAFRSWLPEWFEITLATKFENDRWFALVEEFNITGMGHTEAEAKRDMIALLAAYLVSHYKEGNDFFSTPRPIPFRLKFEIRRDILVGRLVAHVASHPIGREIKLLVPPSALEPPPAAAC